MKKWLKWLLIIILILALIAGGYYAYTKYTGGTNGDDEITGVDTGTGNEAVLPAIETVSSANPVTWRAGDEHIAGLIVPRYFRWAGSIWPSPPSYQGTHLLNWQGQWFTMPIHSSWMGEPTFQDLVPFPGNVGFVTEVSHPYGPVA